MRLNRIANTLETNHIILQKFFDDRRTIDTGKEKVYKFYGVNEFKNALDQLSSLDFLKLYIDRIYKDLGPLIYASDNNAINVPQTVYRKFQDQLTTLILVIESILGAIRQALPPENALSINVKLPSSVKDLNDLVKFTDKINKCLSQIIIHPAIQGSITIEAFEPGSKWINLNLGTTDAVKIIGVIVWASVIINREIQANALMEETLKARQLNTEALRHVVEANKVQMNLLLHAEAEQIYNKNFSDNPEQLERLKYSIKTFSEIIKDGGDIQPSLNAAKELRAEFPTDLPVNLLESKSRAKQIDGTNE